MNTQYTNPAGARAFDTETSDTDPSAEPEYKFDGYKIDLSQKIALTPLPERHHRGHHRDDRGKDAPSR
ncbi:MAG TPA: hypothetical protein VN706_05125 [Gemmatimonadaceae bacterium]|nr:hypothetical protein [Gemmatimonadaceae bacterium]